VLEKMSQNMHMTLSKEARQYIISYPPQVKNYEPLLEELSSIYEPSTFLTLDLVQRVLPPRKKVKIATIIQTVTAEYSISRTILEDPCRRSEIVLPRQIVMYLAREAAHTFPKISRELRRNHATVIGGVKVIQRKMIENEELRKKIDGIRQKLLA
jgi:chromosomal replication initiation ATPase DnaA